MTAADPDLIDVHLTRSDARLLHGLLYDIGEHHAAGAPIAPLADDEHSRFAWLIAVMRLLGAGHPLATLNAATDITLTITQQTAGDIAQRLEALGRYLRDAEPIPHGDHDSIERVGAAIRQLDAALHP